MKVDAIINAADTYLQHGGGVAAAIVNAGGPRIQEESNRVGFCPIGGACVTGAGTLHARHVIHVPTIDWESGQRADAEDIFAGAKAALKMAQSLGLKSVAFPLLGAGVVGIPEEIAEEQIAKAADLFPDMQITLCVRE